MWILLQSLWSSRDVSAESSLFITCVYFRSSVRLWIFISKSLMYPLYVPKLINPFANEQHEAGQNTRRVLISLTMQRDEQTPNVFSQHLLLLVCPFLVHTGHPCGSPKGDGDTWVPPAQVHGDAFPVGKEMLEEATVTRAVCGLRSKRQHLSLSLSQHCSEGNLICL